MTEGTTLSSAELDALELAVSDGVAEGREAVREAGEAGIQLDAIVCASDSLALGALLMVGPDVPVIGYDNTPVAEAVGLSSVEQPLEEVASAALRLIMGPSGSELVDWSESPTPPRHRLIAPRLVTRHRRIS